LHFGDGDNIEAGPLPTLDIVAHEYGHAITEYTSGLAYDYESGALDESYSDLMGALVEFWSEPDGPRSWAPFCKGADRSSDFPHGFSRSQ
jgi:bacillolysin